VDWQFQLMLKRGGKVITSGDLFADAEHKMSSDSAGAATMHFVSSMQRAESGIDFEDKTYTIYLLRVNPDSYSRTKVAQEDRSHTAASFLQ